VRFSRRVKAEVAAARAAWAGIRRLDLVAELDAEIGEQAKGEVVRRYGSLTSSQ